MKNRYTVEVKTQRGNRLGKFEVKVYLEETNLLIAHISGSEINIAQQLNSGESIPDMEEELIKSSLSANDHDLLNSELTDYFTQENRKILNTMTLNKAEDMDQFFVF